MKSKGPSAKLGFIFLFDFLFFVGSSLFYRGAEGTNKHPDHVPPSLALLSFQSLVIIFTLKFDLLIISHYLFDLLISSIRLTYYSLWQLQDYSTDHSIRLLLMLVTKDSDLIA